MKKILACVLTVVMMLSLGTIFTSAVSGSWVTSADEFTPVGNIVIDWDPDAASKITFDGDMSEWASYNMTEIGPNSFASWVGGSDEGIDPGMPTDFSMKCYFVADAKGLYIGFYITDDHPVPTPNPADYLAGDSFQIGMDFGYVTGRQLEIDPDVLDIAQDIFYSFGLQTEGNPFMIIRQNRLDNTPEELNKDDEDDEYNGIDGCTGTTSTGWCAEFFLSWRRMFQDAKYKSWLGEGFGVKIGPDTDLEIGCSLYHIGHGRDADGNDTGMNWAAGTMKGAADENGKPIITWETYDDGIKLILKYKDGMTFEEPGIVIVEEGDTGGFVTEPETEAPTVGETEAPTAAPETEAPTAADGTEAPTAADGTAAGTAADTTDASETGCASVIGGSVALVLAAMAAAVALKKH